MEKKVFRSLQYFVSPQLGNCKCYSLFLIHLSLFFFQDAFLPLHTFTVRVRPLVSERAAFVAFLEDEATPILQRHLDAAKLGMLTGANPVYEVLEPPAYGRIIRRVRSSGSGSGDGGKDRYISF